MTMTIDLDVLKEIARRAGDAIMEVYTGQVEVEYKDDRSPLTAADKAAHAVIVAGLKQNWPEIPILSEEGAEIAYAERQNWQRFWLVDPLDGTKEFIKKNGEFTVNIALIEEGQPTLGVVYVPAQEKTYLGVVGQQATVQQGESVAAPIQVRQVDPTGLTVVMSRSHPSAELEAYLQGMNVKEALPVGSSMKLCVVAEGKADLYPRLGPTMEWDTAAGHAVVLAAGGTVQTPAGEDLVYNKENLLNPFFIVKADFPAAVG